MNVSKLLILPLLNLLLTSVLASPAWSAPATPPPKNLAVATFAGGCFWCMEAVFDDLKGVVSATSGYTGGRTENPTYREVSSETTGHAEAVQVVFDPKLVSYSQLLSLFWHNVDPVDAGGQFCDRGDSYRSAIFVSTPEQQKLAEQSKQQLESSRQLPKPIVTAIVPAAPFYPAEDYHQSYHKTHSLQYKYYRFACGRDQRLDALWGNLARVGAPTR